MKKLTSRILVFGGIFVVAIALYFFFKPASVGQYDEFAQCLTENGAKMYGTSWCSYCQKQKDLFGSSFKYVDFVDCDKNKQECLSAGVTGYPTWKINGENYPGLQSLDRLVQLSRCGLE
jgi:glutaredoxin